MTVKDYKELMVWQKGIEIVDNIYRITVNFPSQELYGLSTQMRRAAVSIPSNIAEGFMRQHTKEYIQFLRISLGSCAELDTQMIISIKRCYLSKNEFDCLQEEINHEMRMMLCLIRSLEGRGS